MPQSAFLMLCCVQVEYFNNQVICDLVEAPHNGVLAILDEACLNVGKVTDTVFLDAMSDKLRTHKHFMSRKVSKGSHFFNNTVLYML